MGKNARVTPDIPAIVLVALVLLAIMPGKRIAAFMDFAVVAILFSFYGFAAVGLLKGTTQ